ncbi:MAG: HK97-gp10 family putative phage morphogenesis protein [Pseudomonadota bacterium]
MARMKYVTGLDDVRKAFKRMSEEGARELTDALGKGAAEIESTARMLAPVGEEDERHMRDTISSTVRPLPNGRGVQAIVAVGTDAETRDAALRTEFGRAPGGVGQEGHPGHDPQPFFFTAYQAVAKRVRSRVKRAIAKAARRTVQR